VYEVELLQRIELTYDPATDVPPFGLFPQTLKSCGRGFDLDEGTVLGIRPQGRSASEDQCSPGCYEYAASAEIAGVTVLEERLFGRSIGDDLLRASAVVKIGSKCEGQYSIGITPLSEGFVTSRPGVATSDFILFREFTPVNDASTCDAPGSMLLESAERRCYDSWFVRVRDSSGTQVTRDLALNGSGAVDGGS
jgi:hypothetical protein